MHPHVYAERRISSIDKRNEFQCIGNHIFQTGNLTILAHRSFNVFFFSFFFAGHV